MKTRKVSRLHSAWFHPRYRSVGQNRSIPFCLLVLYIGLLAHCVGPSPSSAQLLVDQVVFGPKQYQRMTGSPDQQTDIVTLPTSVRAPFRMQILNGGRDAKDRVTAAWVTLNGLEVVGPGTSWRSAATLDVPVQLTPTNTLTVRLAGKPGSFLIITLIGSAERSPIVTLAPNPLTVTVSSTGMLVATLTPPPLAPGTLQVRSDRPESVVVSPAVAFAAGQMVVTIPVSGLRLGSAVISVSRGETVVSSMVNVIELPEQVLFVYRITPPDVSIEKAEILASQTFGFTGTLVETPGTVDVVEPGERGRTLTLYRPSGALEFVDSTKFQAASYTPTLPSEAEARHLAEEFLRRHGLLPPNPQVTVRLHPIRTEQGDVPNTIAVTFEPHLTVVAQMDVPIRDGDVTVWLGNQGDVVRLLGNFRQIEPTPLSAQRKSFAEALVEIETKLGSTSRSPVASGICSL